MIVFLLRNDFYMRDLQEIYPVDIVINLLNNALAKKNCYCTIDLWNSDMYEMSSVIVEFVEVEDRSFATYQLSLVILNSVWRQLVPWSLEIHLGQVMISFIYNI